MSFDHITETITHFIGTFQMTTEAMRLRDAYDGFRYRPDAPSPDVDQVHVNLRITSPYDLEGFDPKLKLELPATASGQSSIPSWDLAPQPQYPLHGYNVAQHVAPPAFRFATYHESEVQWRIPLPPEVITVTLQSLYLADNDLLDFRGGTQFLAPQGLMEQMHVYAAQAAAMGGDLSNLIYQLLPDAGPPSGAQVLAFADQLAALPVLDGDFRLIRLETQEAETVSDTSPADAPVRIYVNGEATDALPNRADYLPAPIALRIDPPEEDTEETIDASASAGYAEKYGVEGGHHLTTGENLTVNEAYIAANGVDADVLLIGGSWVQIDAISQVNLAYTTAGAALAYPINNGTLIARPTASVDLSGAAVSGTESHAMGLSGLSGTTAPEASGAQSSSEMAEASGATRAFNAARIDPSHTVYDPEAASAAPPPQNFPAHWQVERIDGDVVFENRIDQHIFASDHDSVEAVFTASASQISTGGNTLSNFTTIQALSQHYDFIIIGGNYTSLNVIQQVNVLFDVDHIIGGTADTGIWGWGNNLLMNTAEILHSSRDAMHEMQESFTKELESLAAGGATLSASVAQNELFAGRDILSALYISGDLIESNIIRQFSYLGDVDQIALAEGAAMVGALAAGMSIDTGENAMMNAARINDLGINSAVMAAGQVYSDALIHQAGLIDDQMPGLDGLSGSLGALTSEAVAFLAPEMMETALPNMPQGHSTHSDYAATHAPQDGMHLMVA